MGLLFDVFVNIIKSLVTVQSYSAFTFLMFYKRYLMFHQKHENIEKIMEKSSTNPHGNQHGLQVVRKEIHLHSQIVAINIILLFGEPKRLKQV